jgi:hypothetical protein
MEISMAWVPVTVEHSAYLAARIAAFARECPEWLRRHAPAVAECAALPLYVGWWETVALRANGEVICWSNHEGVEEYEGTRTVDEVGRVLGALVDGARRYPRLSELFPVRGARDPDCRCLTTHEFFVSRRIICPDCGGLGWRPRSGWWWRPGF